MAQFGIYRVDGHGLVVDCQSDLLSDLQSRIVAPLRAEAEDSVSLSRLNPRIEVDGIAYRVATQFLRSVDRRVLGEHIGSANAIEWEIKTAVDMLISGF
ncbi:CcdB family protein [uncultured Sphingomonas sp.]|uniref:CcdB family protein n=1 Tax=uncultured Sphingomonas sp. TaxID=158754 RepID=UPI0025E6B674|nr:CcdB family protein [uncultured Sphingomonas sp.]